MEEADGSGGLVGTCSGGGTGNGCAGRLELVSELWAWVVVDGAVGERRAPGWGCVVRVSSTRW